jgi:DNA (cytosine-5)-methyltransferase 1
MAGGGLELNTLKYYEFFAGVGMARAGLGDGWKCLFANDSDKFKQKSYANNWNAEEFDPRDVAMVTPSDLDGLADLAWASFPCQDLSQAGSKAGIGEAQGSAPTRSGAVWPFLNIIRGLAEEERHPVLLALENVTGLLSSNGGADLRSLCSALSEIGYRFGAVVADASHFVPQSRPRVFVIAIRREIPIPALLQADMPQSPWHTQGLIRARAGLSAADAENWVWWSPGKAPEAKVIELEEIINLGDDADWNSDEATLRLLGMMSQSHLDRLAVAKAAGRPMVGSLYLRMRPVSDGGNVQRAEIAFGATLGCLRTPKGGASRPRIIAIDGERVRTRLLSVSEAAQLMGLNEDFDLPAGYHECFRLIGDGVVPAVVRFLANTLLEPLAKHGQKFVFAKSLRKASA